jgi:transcriptional regulator
MILHKMNLNMHKDNNNNNFVNKKNEDDNNYDIRQNKLVDSKKDLELEKEERLAQMLSLHTKGLTQKEIAGKLDINQSTVSRDLHYIRQNARAHIENYLQNDIPFEFQSILRGLDEIIKTIWNIVEDQEVAAKEKYNFLNLLASLYTKRMQLLIGGEPKEYLNLNHYINEVKHKEKYGPLLEKLY